MPVPRTHCAKNHRMERPPSRSMAGVMTASTSRCKSSVERARYAYFAASVWRRAVKRASGFLAPGWRNISRWRRCAGRFFHEQAAKAFEPDAESTVRILLGVGEKQREILRDGFINPLVAVAGPANDVAPPLMSHFVVRNQFGEVFLPGRTESGALLRFGGQEGIRGNVKQAGPALRKSPRNLRDAQDTEGERAAERFVKANRGVNLFS